MLSDTAVLVDDSSSKYKAKNAAANKAKPTNLIPNRN